MARKTADTSLPKPIDWDEEKAFEGYYVKTTYGLDSVHGTFDAATFVEVDSGDRRSAVLTTDLARGMEQVPPGAHVWITYKGKEKIGGGKSVKRFEVDYDDEDKIDVPAAAPRPSAQPAAPTAYDEEPF